MIRRLLPALGIVLALVATVSAQEKSVKPGINDPFKDPDLKKYLSTFEGESREIFSQREAILKAVGLKAGMHVADIGAGTGLFTRAFAAQVGPDGKVYAVDIAKKFLEHIEKTAKDAKLGNITTVLCTDRSTELKPGTIDLAFVCDTYHHFEFPQRTLASLHAALRPGGKLIVLDFHRIPGKSREWTLNHVRAGQEVFTREIQEAGFKLLGEEKKLGLKENYFLRFEKLEPKKAPEIKKPAEAKKPEAKLQFNRDIRPILSDACFTCHGPDKAKRKGGLRLDLPETARAALGTPEDSEFLFRLSTDNVHQVMPPPKSPRQLTKDEIATLKRWVAEGASYEAHWAFVPPTTRGPVAIDPYIDAAIARAGLKANEEAPRSTLIRRLSYDLTGLPPTPAEVDAFVNDTRPDAYERLVERLLASPRFGERFAMDWLDSARYADSNGYQSDRDRTMWPWRDWAVRAFNANQPFDQFTVEQVAGDLLPGATTEQRLASGFHRNHPLNGEGGRIAEESRVDYVVDRVDTTATVWLGLTLGCARCHDHKYDPFTAKDYYRLYAYFNSIDESGAVDRGGNASPVMELPTPAQVKQKAEHDAKVRTLEARAKAASAKIRPSIDKELKAARDARTAFERGILNVMVMRDRPTPRDSFILLRGAYDKYGEKVTPGVIESLAPPPGDAPPNRLTLARWLIDPRHPLTARVIVNRYWQLLLGNGLVKTPEDFGVQSEMPSHPELLDMLAVEFRDGGWDLKALVRRIVTSAVYKRSSRQTAEQRERDPLNRLLARGPRYRLPSLMIRDQALAFSGLLVEQIGGPPVKPYQPPGIWEEFSFGFIRYQQDHGSALYRRGLYTFWRRTVGPTNLFDTAARLVCEVKPVRTNTPLHALVTLNDVTYAEAYRVLAERVLREGGSDRIGWLFKLATARTIQPRERAVLERTHERLLAQYRADPKAAEQKLRAGEWRVPNDLPAAELAALAGVCSLVLNLDEVITRE
jgi:ubiquinone/menaquinone biosynthesis C-methylase UbiE